MKPESPTSLQFQCEETAADLRQIDQTPLALIEHLDECALAFERSGKTVEVILNFGGPSMWLEVTPTQVHLCGRWWGQHYRRSIQLRDETREELLCRA